MGANDPALSGEVYFKLNILEQREHLKHGVKVGLPKVQHICSSETGDVSMNSLTVGGNVGIGTNNPTSELTIFGDISEALHPDYF